MSELTPVEFDLSGHELARLAAVLSACSDDLNLLTMYHAECDARRLLYSSLDAEQRAIHRQLTDAGILTAAPLTPAEPPSQPPSAAPTHSTPWPAPKPSPSNQDDAASSNDPTVIHGLPRPSS